MSVPRYRVLFLLEADTDLLLEIQRLDVRSEQPAEVYFWFRFDKASCALQPLTFVSMSEQGAEQRRGFTEGQLVFGEAAGTYQPHPAGPPLTLRTATADPLPPAADAAVRAFLAAR